MPLHPQHPPGRVRRLRALDDAIVNGAGGDAERRRHSPQRLVMKGVRPELIRTGRARQTRAWIDADVVDAGVPWIVRGMCDGGGKLARNVLNERSAQGNVRHLNSAADRECRQATAVRLVDQRNLALVAALVRLDRGMGLLAIARGRHILATSDHEASDATKDGPGPVGWKRWHDERHQASGDERLGVREVDANARSAANDLGGGGDGDERWSGVDR